MGRGSSMGLLQARCMERAHPVASAHDVEQAVGRDRGGDRRRQGRHEVERTGLDERPRREEQRNGRQRHPEVLDQHEQEDDRVTVRDEKGDDFHHDDWSLKA